MEVAAVRILGVKVSAVNMDVALAAIEGWVAERSRHYVCVSGAHGLTESHYDPELRRIHNEAGMVTPDGMPLVWFSHWMGLRHVERVCGPDLLPETCARSQARGYRHFFYGGGPGVAALLARRLEERYPGLQITGVYEPPFRPLTPEEDRQVVERINAARPDIVWVGLSTPKQERWMAEHRDRIEAPVLIGIGAAFDFHAGLRKRAPRWMQRSGLEWAFRLLSEPGRLWRRYLIGHAQFMGLLALQLLAQRNQILQGFGAEQGPLLRLKQ